MRPLLFVDWRSVSARFTALMWWIAAILAAIVLLHAVSHHADSTARVGWRGAAPGTATTHLLAAHRP